MRVRGEYGAQISVVEASTDAVIPLLHPPNSAPPHHITPTSLIEKSTSSTAMEMRLRGSSEDWDRGLRTCVSLLDGVGVRPNAL